MKRFSIKLLSFALLGGFLFACVPARKYDEVKAKMETLEQENKSLKNKYQDIEAANNEMKADIERLEKRKGTLETDFRICEESLASMTSKYDKLNEINNELLRKLDMLRSGSEAESRQLASDLTATQRELQDKEDKLRALERELEAKRANLDKLSKDLESRSARVEELEGLIAAKDAKVKALQARVKEALLAFEGKGLNIEQRNGKIYVQMEAKLLFASGSTKVGNEGKGALVKLAKVIEDQKDLEIMVEGHTDTDKINSSSFPRDNWDLSVLRATSVVNIMLDNSTINPTTITAAGKSEFVPVDPGDKSKNRRIEIVLVPNLDALFKAIENTGDED